MMSEASTGVDAEMRLLTLAVRGFQERSRTHWDAPQGQTGCPKEKKNSRKPKSFSLAHF